jgi:hypothetical protein
MGQFSHVEASDYNTHVEGNNVFESTTFLPARATQLSIMCILVQVKSEVVSSLVC